MHPLRTLPGSFIVRVAIGLALFAAHAPAQNTTVVSVTPGGGIGNGHSTVPAISADGRFVAFASSATNLLGVANGPATDIFVRDRLTQTTTLVSASTAGAPGNGPSDSCSISADGRFVAFESRASNLVPGDTNGAEDVFVRDVLLGTTTRVSVDSLGNQTLPPFDNFLGGISADGRCVAFGSAAPNLVSGDVNGDADVFVHDLQTGATTLEDLTFQGLPGEDAASPAISADGRFVSFETYSGSFVPDDTNGTSDIFVHDRLANTTTRVSVSSTGEEGNGISRSSAISGDGRFVAFQSEATNLVPGDTLGKDDIFVHDLQTGQTTRVSVDSSGAESNGLSANPVISLDGSTAAFWSAATNLVPGDTNAAADVFIHDLASGATSRASVGTTGTQGGADSFLPALSADGRFVAFESLAVLAQPDDNTTFGPLDDIYVRDTFVPWAVLPGGLAGAQGIPSLAGTGPVLGGTTITLAASQALPLAPTFLVAGLLPIDAPFKGGTLVPTPSLLIALPTNAAGAFAFSALWPEGVPSATKLWFQDWIVDAAGPQGFAATNGVALTTP